MKINKQVADIIASIPKSILEPIEWKTDPNRGGVYEFRVSIECDYPGRIFMKGSYNRKLDRFSFVIIYNGFRIKALDVGKTHTLRCPIHGVKKVGNKHKHSWQDCCKDKWAYEPDDITTGAPIHQVFEEFLRECNISYNGKLPPLPPEQLELWRYEVLGN